MVRFTIVLYTAMYHLHYHNCQQKILQRCCAELMTLLLHSHVNLQIAQALLNTKVYCRSHLLLCGQDQLGPQYHECHLHHLFGEMHEISVFGHSWENTNLMKASCGWTQNCHDSKEDKNRSCEVNHSHLSRTFMLTQRMPNQWRAQWS